MMSFLKDSKPEQAVVVVVDVHMKKNRVYSDNWLCVWAYAQYCINAHCNTLQHIATHCNTLQHTATHCSTLPRAAALQHPATHCNTLQHNSTQCNTLQHPATHCNTLQHPATHCNTLQHTATHLALSIVWAFLVDHLEYIILSKKISRRFRPFKIRVRKGYTRAK